MEAVAPIKEGYKRTAGAAAGFTLYADNPQKIMLLSDSCNTNHPWPLQRRGMRTHE